MLRLVRRVLDKPVSDLLDRSGERHGGWINLIRPIGKIDRDRRLRESAREPIQVGVKTPIFISEGCIESVASLSRYIHANHRYSIV